MIALVRDQTSTSGAYTVSEIAQFWRQRLWGLFPNHPARYEWAQAIVQYACPPPSQQAFAAAMAMYRRDYAEIAETLSAEEADAVLAGITERVLTKCVNVRQSWVIFTRMQDIERKTQAECARTISCARRQFRQLLDPAQGHQGINAVNLYKDVSALEQRCRTLLDCPWVGDWCEEHFWKNLRSTVDQYVGPESDEQTLAMSAALREIDAIANKRGVGMAERAGERSASVAGTGRLSADAPALEAEPTASIRHSSPAPTDSTQTAPPKAYEAPNLSSGQKRLARSFSRWSVRDNADSTQPLTERQITQLPVTVRSSVVRRQHAFSLRGALKNACDVHRLTPGALTWALNQAQEPAEILFLVLLILGWQPRDAEKLRVEPGRTKAEKTDDPSVIAESELLWLVLPISGSGQARADQRLSLVINGGLKSIVEKLAEGQPLVGLREQLNRCWKQKWPPQHGGLMPTCNRVRAAGWLVVRPLCGNDMEAQMFSGRLDFASTVAATYRQIEPGEMQRIFEKVIDGLGLGGEVSDAMNVYMRMESVPALGSRCQLDWPMLRRLNQALQQALDRQQRRLKVPKASEQHAEANFYMDLVWTQLYVALMLVSAGRPWGESTRGAITGSNMWLREKSSKAGEESRWLPVPDSLLQAIERLDEWALQLRRSSGASTDGRAPQDRLALPDRIYFSRGMRKVQLKPYSNSAFRQLLRVVMGEQDPVVAAFDQHTNALRHLVATTSQSHLSFAKANALLGHHHGFDANTQPESFQPISEAWEDLTQFQNKLLKSVGFQPHTLVPVTDLLRRPLP